MHSSKAILLAIFGVQLVLTQHGMSQALGTITGLSSRTSSTTVKATPIPAPAAGQSLFFTGTPASPFSVRAITTADVSGNWNASRIDAGVLNPARLGSGTMDGATVLYSDGVWRAGGDVYLGNANNFTAAGSSWAFSPRWNINPLAGVTAGTTMTLALGGAYQGSVSVNSSIVFSGVPSSGDTVLLLLAVTNSPVITIPSSVRVGEANTSVTTLQLSAGRHWLEWTYSGSDWVLRDTLATSDAVTLALRATDPAAPPTGQLSLYAKTDLKVYTRDSAGTITELTATGGGGGGGTVATGGTGVTSLTAFAPIFGGATSTGAVQSGTVGTSGQVLTSNGPGALPTFQAPAGGGGGGGAASTITSRRTDFSLHEEFFSASTTTTAGIGQFGFTFKNTGSASGNGGFGASADAPGVWQFKNGTAATGVGGIGTDSTSVRFGAATYTLEWRVRLTVINDGVDTYTARIGFIDAFTNIESFDGVYFRYSPASGVWNCITRLANSSETVVPSSTVVAPLTWYKLRVVVTDSTSAVFTINDGDTQTITTTIPTDSASRVTGIGATICRNLGTVSSGIDADYCSMDVTLNAAR